MNLANISPTDLREFAKAKGWKQLREATEHRLYVLSNSTIPNRQIIFPMDNDSYDYVESIDLAIRKLSEIYNQNYISILNEIMTIRDDTLQLRIGKRSSIRSISLSYAASMIYGAQQMILSGACTVLKPQRHHPRMSRTEAQSLIQKTRFGHTEEGSFLLRISCPINAVEAEGDLFNDEQGLTFARKSMLAVVVGTSKLVKAIEDNNIDDVFGYEMNDGGPIISSNLCDAISNFQDFDFDGSVEIDVSWSPLCPTSKRYKKGPIRIQQGYFSIIDDIGRTLRHNQKHKEDLFIGTVEQLEGEMSPDGSRHGDVILSLLLNDGETVRARAFLDVEGYKKADKAHMTEGAYVKVYGKLHPGRQPRQLTDIRKLQYIGPPS